MSLGSRRSSFLACGLTHEEIRIKDYGVNVFWDFENLEVTLGQDDLFNLTKLIQKALETLETRLFINGKPLGIGKVKNSNYQAVHILRNNGFRLKDVNTKTVRCDGCNSSIRSSANPNNDDPHERKTDVADTLLVTEILFSAIKYYACCTTPRYIMVITGDQDFIDTLEELSDKGFRILLVIPDEDSWVRKLPALRARFSGVWYWKALKIGGSCA